MIDNAPETNAGGGLSSGSVEPGKEPEPGKAESEYRARQYFREGQTSLEVLTKATEKRQILNAARTLMSGFENMSLHPDGEVSEYRLGDVISLVESRAQDLEYEPQALIDLGLMRVKVRKEPVIDENGKVQVENGQIVTREVPFYDFEQPGFAYKSVDRLTLSPPKYVFDAEGNVVRQEREVTFETVYLPGSPDERKNLSETLHAVEGEMVAREDLVKMLRWVWGQTENLEGLVQLYYKGSLTKDAMEILCNAEGRTRYDKESGKDVSVLTKTEGGVEYREGHEFGDAISVALQCFEIAALSEKPEELEALLKRPGIKFLFDVTDQEIDDLFIRPEDRPNRQLKSSLVKWIGEPWSWWNDKKDPKIENGRKVYAKKEDHLRPVEVNGKKYENKRGLLTERGNILVDSDYSDIEYIFEQVERFIGGGSGSGSLNRNEARDARFIAWGLLRVTGEASDLGYELYYEGDNKNLNRAAGLYPHHDMGGMTSCDRVKVISPNLFRKIYRFVKSEIRSFGPEGSLDKYPDRFTVPYFKNWAIEVVDKVDNKDRHLDTYKEAKASWVKRNANGERVLGKRTFDELRWGYRAGVEKDRLALMVQDGKLVEIDGVTKNLPEEPAYRLGELPWKLLSPKAFNVAALGPYMAGREKFGLFQHMMKTDWDIRELKEKSLFEKLAQYMGVAMNYQTVFKGKFRGVNDIVERADGRIEEIGNNRGIRIDESEVVRLFKKKYLLAFWDGIRSLPQYREWLNLSQDQIREKAGSGSALSRDPIKRIKYRLGKTGILTMEEALSLPENPLNNDDYA
jgi:hypothetical protein